MKVYDIELKEDDQVFVHLPDGSNLAINLRKLYENEVEISVYTSNIDGFSRLNPAIHMVNGNTLSLEIRRKEGKQKKAD